MGYILDLGKLIVGDIVLSSGDGKAAAIIKKATSSHYSHAMLYVDNQINHAIPDGGVYSENPQRLIFQSPQDLKVLRLKRSVELQTLLAICDYSGTLVGSVYSVKEAVAAKVLGNQVKDAKSNDQFCSRLVAQSYASVGIDLVVNPNYCSPSDLERSNELSIVEGAVRLANPQELQFAKTPSPIKKNQDVTYNWLYKARDLASSVGVKIQTINNVNEFLFNCPQFDSAVCDYVRDSGYLEQYLDDMSINSYRYDKKEFLIKIRLSGSQPAAFVRSELGKEDGLVRRMVMNFHSSKCNYEQTGLSFHALHMELYKNILMLVKKRLDVMAVFAEKDESIAIAKLVNIIEIIYK